MAPVSIVLAQLIIVTSVGYSLGRGEEGRTLSGILGLSGS
jgi:hypothetical protein